MDTLHLLSWNVQGLGGQAFGRVKGLLQSDLGTSTIGIIDILFLQEHHLCMDKIRELAPFYQESGLISGFLHLALIAVRMDYALLLENNCNISSCQQPLL